MTLKKYVSNYKSIPQNRTTVEANALRNRLPHSHFRHRFQHTVMEEFVKVCRTTTSVYASSPELMLPDAKGFTHIATWNFVYLYLGNQLFRLCDWGSLKYVLTFPSPTNGTVCTFAVYRRFALNATNTSLMINAPFAAKHALWRQRSSSHAITTHARRTGGKTSYRGPSENFYSLQQAHNNRTLSIPLVPIPPCTL